jgi:phenol hydroxylase P1 protein
MQIELRTQVIEPRRKAFRHLVERYGDRPSSRYEEGSIDVQGVTNFHYRPLWGPDKDIYSPDYSVFKLTDTYSFLDPRQYYYAPYVAARADLHEAFGSTLSYLEKRGLLSRLSPAWTSLIADVLLPLRHYEGAAQMVFSNAARFGWGTTITQCFSYAGFDRIGNAQILSRVGIAVGEGTAEPLALAKTTWLQDDEFQPLRKHIEQILVESDWGKAVVALDVTDQLLYGLFYTALDDTALGDGAGAYSLVAQHLSGWFADQRRWLDHLYKTWTADPELGAENARLLGEAVEAGLVAAQAAIAPIAAKVDTLVDAGATATLEELVASTRNSLASLGAALKEVEPS